MSWIKSKANFFLVIFSIFFSFVAIEIAYKIVLKDENAYKWDQRYMLFSASPENSVLFRNIGPIFTYQPNILVKSKTYYYLDEKYQVEYDYQFKTNNYGLVSDVDINPIKESILIIGDSFTEGQGAEPWFRSLLANVKNSRYQFVNGGLLGTGFAQWSLLNQHLVENKVNLKKAVVIFISDDFIRKTWNFTEQQYRCLADSNQCFGDEFFYKLPQEKDEINFLNKIRDFREQPKNSLKEFSNEFFPATNLIFTFTKQVFRKSFGIRNKRIDGLMGPNKVAINELVKYYGHQNIIFLHLPEKSEVLAKGFNSFGVDADSHIAMTGASLYSGLDHCNLTIDDYHKNDGHPNARGYKKISDCVYLLLNKEWKESLRND
jgi:hypothetical protein